MSAIGKGVGKVASAIGLKGLIRHDKPRREPEMPLPDEEALRKTALKAGARRAKRSGRVSTILDEDTLGG